MRLKVVTELLKLKSSGRLLQRALVAKALKQPVEPYQRTSGYNLPHKGLGAQ